MRTVEDAKLRDNVRMLGSLLGEIITEVAGKELFALVETFRKDAKATVQGDAAAAADLIKLSQSMQPEQRYLVARAFLLFLNLANIAEQYHRIRRTRWHALQEHEPPKPGSILAVLQQLKAEGISDKAIKNSINDLNINLTLTAHPTEVMRRTIMQKYDRIAEYLEVLDRSDLTPVDIEDTTINLKAEILAIWQTEALRRDKPSPLDEARWCAAVIETSLWQALPNFLTHFDRQLQQQLQMNLPLDATPIRFSSWMGGDRDGNPNVTSDVTQKVVYLMRWRAAELYYHELSLLRAELSMVAANKAVRNQVADPEHEPYRQLLKPIKAKLWRTKVYFENKLYERDSAETDIYLEPDELIAVLTTAYDSLHETKSGLVAEGRLKALIRRLYNFGLMLAPLDLRQDQEMHLDAVAELARMDEVDFIALDEKGRQEFLLSKLAAKQTADFNALSLSSETSEVLATMSLVAELPKGSFQSYVISMCSAPSDILAVLWLQTVAGVAEPLPIVPLFETLADLQAGPEVLEQLFSIKAYRRQIADFQEVMIGYSDSAKDAGMIAAAWGQYQACEAISKVAAKHKIKLRLFHGRGGSTGRGGAPTFSAIMSQPPGSVNGSIRVTKQGEVIRHRFGLMPIAERTLEVYVAATMGASLCPAAEPKAEWRQTLSELTTKTAAAYRQLTREQEDFPEFFHQVSPINELGSLAIGSRPAKRKVGGGWSSLRAIPWIFAWTQNRLLLPSWLGIAEFFAAAKDQDKWEQLELMAESWPFMRSLLDLLEMVLAKAEPNIFHHYELRLLPEDAQDLAAKLRHSFAESVAYMLEFSKQDTLLAKQPVIQRGIEVRNPYLLPLNLLQVELLAQYREQPEPELLRAILTTVAGIAAGMRNTG